MSQSFLTRAQTEKDLYKFLESEKSGLVFLRGRRRVGKSSLLRKKQEENQQSIFYFGGAKDERSELTIIRFVQNWIRFIPKSSLRETNPALYNWGYIFEKVELDISKRHISTWIFFDEIQWLAKGQSGFISLFKEAWLSLKKHKHLKLVLCGSSNKFFVDNVRGEEKILRGLITHADIFLPPFTLTEVKQHFAKDLTKDEAHFLYMCFGGIPYYLEQFNFEVGFISGFNDCVFTRKSIFLNEIEEVLNLELNISGVRTALKLFSGFRQRFSDVAGLIKNSRLAASTTVEMIDKLVKYNLIFELEHLHERSLVRRANAFLYCKDFFINFYTRVLSKYQYKIKKNDSSNIFSTILTSKQNLYIESFTGIAFENYVQDLIDNKDSKTGLYSDLSMTNDEEAVFIASPDSNLTLLTREYKIIRQIECKWCYNQSMLQEGIKLLAQAKEIQNFKNLKYLITNLAPIKSVVDVAKSHKIKIVTI
jgi:AAA+ ATPase superfamily predicted ATPase